MSKFTYFQPTKAFICSWKTNYFFLFNDGTITREIIIGKRIVA